MKTKNLTIHEAFNSGQKFRLMGSEFWVTSDYTFKDNNYSLKSVCSDNWEIPERKIEITESQFDEIVHTVKRFNASTVENHKKKLFGASND